MKRENSGIHRTAFLLLAVFMLLALSACGGRAHDKTPASAVEEPAASPAALPAHTASPETPAPTPEPAGSITLTGGERTEHVCGVPFSDPGFSAQDKHGRDMTERVTVEGEVRFRETGEYELSYSFSDDEGTEIKALRTVEVVPAFLPETEVKEKVIYLSFDDGPCGYTPELLELLAEYDAKATFFVITAENDYLYLLSDIASAGHTVGVHCAYHRPGKIYPTKDMYLDDLISAREAIFEITGEYPTVVRFPGGSPTAFAYAGQQDGGVEGLYEILHTMGMREYDWNVQPENDDNNGEDLYYAFIKAVPEQETPVVLQHDTRLYSIHALRKVLEWGAENGYTFEGLDCTVPEVHQKYKEN